MVKFIDCKAIGCDKGYVFSQGSDAELIRSNAEHCNIGYLEIGKEQEQQMLLEKMLSQPEALKHLAEAFKAAKPEAKQEAIRKSQLFEYLSAFANASTVYTFIEGVIKSIFKIP